MAININTYKAHSYFTDNSNGLMQFMQTKGRENQEEKENQGMNNNIPPAPIAPIKFPPKVANYQLKKRKKGFGNGGLTYAAKVRKNTQSAGRGK